MARPRGNKTYSKEYNHLYKSARWRKMRQSWLSQYPYCQCPHCKGKNRPANIVDHKTPHHGDKRLFFNTGNLQSMTKECHDRFKQSQELGGHGFMRGCDEHGKPLNQEHPWYG